MSEVLLGGICFLSGLGVGWSLWRNERTYLEGFADGQRYGRAEALAKISRGYLINPETLDWYNK